MQTFTTASASSSSAAAGFAFATISEAVERKNLSIPGAYPVAIDYGYSGVKGIAPDKVFCYPNCAIRIEESSLDKMLYTSPDDIFLRNGDGLWVIGTKADELISSANAMNYEHEMYGRNRYFTPAFRALMTAGLGIALSPTPIYNYSGEPIFVQTGLPPEFRKPEEPDSSMLTEAISGEYDFELKAGDGPFRKYKFTISPENIMIMDQPMGSLLASITHEDGSQTPNDSAILRSKTIVFDAGFMTLDIFDISSGTIAGERTFDTLGMHEVFRRTVGELRSKHKVGITVPGMQQALRKGYVTSYDWKTMSGKNIAFDDILKGYSETVCREAISKLESVCAIQDHAYLVVTGGTGEAWYSQIAQRYSQLSFLNIIRANRYSGLSNVYSTVWGYYMWLIGYRARRRR